MVAHSGTQEIETGLSTVGYSNSGIVARHMRIHSTYIRKAADSPEL